MKIQTITEKVIQILKFTETPLRINEISKIMMIKSESAEYNLLKSALNNLSDQGIIERMPRRRWQYISEDDLSALTGTLRIESSRGVVYTKSKDFPIIFIKQRYLGTAFDGDEVRLRIMNNKTDKRIFGEVLEIKKRGEYLIGGDIEYDGDSYYLVPDDPKFYVDFLIPKDKLGEAKPGFKAVGKLINWSDIHKSPRVEIVNVIGKSGSAEVEFEAIVEEFNLPYEFTTELEIEANKIKAPKNLKTFKDRLDLREHDIFTIDPFDAKDFDDAVSLEKLENGNWLAGIHIADVSHYIEENTIIDSEARSRGNSTYLVDRVIPMIPENLSNDICSLKPDVIRMTFTVLAELDSNMNVVDYKIRESVIKSKRRFNYDEVLEIIETGKGDFADTIADMHQVAMALKDKRFLGGGIDFETREVRFKLNDEKFPERTLVKSANKATSLIEEFMLLANKIVAKHIVSLTKELKKKNQIPANITLLPFIYRVHDEPDSKSLFEALEFIGGLIDKHIKKKKVSSREINELLHSFKGHAEETFVSSLLVRSMPRAIYSQVNTGHYGLGFDFYTHFTSPIRRYPDLIVHRLLKEYANTPPNGERITYLSILMRTLGNDCSKTERQSMEAERASTKLALTMIAEKHLGEIFDGTISGVQPFGIFISLDDLAVEGLLHIRDITDDYYYYDEKSFCLKGKRTGRILRLGGRIKVKIAKANIQKRTVDFVMQKEK